MGDRPAQVEAKNFFTAIGALLFTLLAVAIRYSNYFDTYQNMEGLMQATTQTAQVAISYELDFKKELERYMVGTDHMGIERWFDKTRYECSAEGETLTVLLTEKEWNKRMASVEPKEVVVTRTRRCLCCRETVQLEKNMFVCLDCKSRDFWRNGSSPYAI